MLDSLLVLSVSLAALVLSSQWVITQAVKLARFFRVSDAAIGFLLISVATSLPELMVSIQSALKGTVSLGIGNVLGANISDVCLGTGLVALTAGIYLKKGEYSDLTKSLLVASLLPFLMFLEMGNFLGFVLLAVFVLYAMMMWRKEEGNLAIGQSRPSNMQAVVAFAFFCASVAAVVYSSNYAVNSALDLSKALGVSAAFVGGVVLALGTTLPEISVSLAAIRRRNTGLAIGNLVGSCVVNLTLVLGAAAIIRPLRADFLTFMDLAAFSVLANVILFVFVRSGKLEKMEGAAMLGLYIIYVFVMFAMQANGG